MTTLEPIGVIINPWSGQADWKEAERAIDNSLNFDSRKVKVFKGKEVYKSACKLLDWANLIIVIGGDGSLNSVIKAIMDMDKDPALLFIPAGTANDMAYNLNLPKNPYKSLQLISEGEVRAIDIGKVDVVSKRYIFVNVFGLAGSVDLIDRFKKMNKNKPKFLSYLSTAGKTIYQGLSPTEIDAKIKFKNSTLWKSKDSALCIVSNGRRCGRFFKVAPKARLDDGLFDFCFAGKFLRLSFVLDLFNYMNGRFILGPKVEKTNDYLPQAKEFELKLKQAKKFQIDGDIVGKGRKFYIKNIEKRIKVLTPKTQRS